MRFVLLMDWFVLNMVGGSMSDYVVVTAISSHRMRYVMHKDDLRKLNTDVDPTDAELIDWAKDSVTMLECEEFSQMHIGESIIDVMTTDEDTMLQMFDIDNDYFKNWDKEKKLEWIRKGFTRVK
jgi:hypothetical protein